MPTSTYPQQKLLWKPVTQKYLGELREHYLKFEPYCDFNALNLWGYMGRKARWSRVGDTVIYELRDYLTESAYYSILGDKDVKTAIRELCAARQTQEVVLENVPAKTVESLAQWTAIANIQEDFANHDYIYDARALSELNSSVSSSKRKAIRQLTSRHPNLSVVSFKRTDVKMRRRMYRLFRQWVAENNKEDYEIELRALKRVMNAPDENIVCVGVFDGKSMIGYTVNEIDANQYYQAHFGKSRHAYRGISIYLEHVTAEVMFEQYGLQFMNLQQDLGLSGLSSYKQSLGPIKLLKKYIVHIDLNDDDLGL